MKRTHGLRADFELLAVLDHLVDATDLVLLSLLPNDLAAVLPLQFFVATRVVVMPCLLDSQGASGDPRQRSIQMCAHLRGSENAQCAAPIRTTTTHTR
jgi:hypothetical protein